MASANALATRARLLLRPAAAARLRAMRDAVAPAVAAAAAAAGLPTAAQLMAAAPRVCQRRASFLSYFSLHVSGARLRCVQQACAPLGTRVRRGRVVCVRKPRVACCGRAAGGAA
jgi:hypothetical protein